MFTVRGQRSACRDFTDTTSTVRLEGEPLNPPRPLTTNNSSVCSNEDLGATRRLALRDRGAALMMTWISE